jgi:hypothetical protein
MDFKNRDSGSMIDRTRHDRVHPTTLYLITSVVTRLKGESLRQSWTDMILITRPVRRI